MNFKVNWDGLGIITSVACAIHCALLPLLVTSLPLFGINIIHNRVFEWSMIGLAFVVGSYSLIHGYRKHHRNLLPLSLFSLGFVFLLTKQFFHDYEAWFLIPAVVFIVTAHWRNYKLCHRVKCSSPHHTH
jgi:MerC mercury resistance protein